MGGQQRAGDVLRDMLALHRQKHVLMEELSGITVDGAGLDVTDQTEKLLPFLEVRQACMDRVDAIDAEIVQHQKRFFELRDREYGAGSLPGFIENTLEEVREQQQAVRRLVERIQELDRQQKSALELQFSKLKKMREELRVSRQTVNAYRKKPSLPESVFIDKKK